MMQGRRIALAVAMALGSSAAYADWSNDWFRVSGFGTAAITKNTGDNTYYRLGMLQPSGARDGWDGGALNKLGVQATVRPLSWLEGTVQVVSQRQYDDGYDPVFDWAFVKAKINDNLSVRAGRMVLPGFMMSESRNVGYANTMITPPIDVYNLLPLTKFDGFDLTLRGNVADVLVSVTPYAGKRREPTPSGQVLELDQIYGLNAVAEWSNWSFRAGFTRATLNSPNETADALWGCMHGTSTTLSAACPAYAAAVPIANGIAAEYEIKNKDASFSGIGVQYDDGKYLGASEIVQRETDSYIPDAMAWYIMAGMRVKSFTPYVGFSRLKNESEVTDGRLASQSLSGGLATLNAVLSAGVNASLASLASDHTTYTLGTRWDFYKNLALKLQYDHVKINYNQGATYKYPYSSGGSTPRMNLYSATLDFVF